MESRTSIKRKNFGLSSNSNTHDEDTNVEDYSNWFWESKSQKKLRQDTKKAEVERMRAETAAMQQILTEQDQTQSSGMNIGKVALIGGLVILLGIGAVSFMMKKKNQVAPDRAMKAEDLIV